jgi:hypothetical protein
MRKEKLLYAKNTYVYILKLLLKVVTVGVKALVSGNKLLYVACEFSHVLYCETQKNCIVSFRRKVWNADIRCSAPP